MSENFCLRLFLSGVCTCSIPWTRNENQIWKDIKCFVESCVKVDCPIAFFLGYTSATPTFCSYIALVKNVIAMTRSCNTDILLLLWEWIIVWYWLFFIKVAFLTLTEKIPFCSKDFQFPEKKQPCFSWSKNSWIQGSKM